MVGGAGRENPSAAEAGPDLPASEERERLLALLEAERTRNDQLEVKLLELQSAQLQLESYAADLQQASAELRRHLSHMTVLHEVSRAISSALDPDEVMSRALDALADLIPYQAVSVYLLDEQDLLAKCTASRGEVDPPPPPHVSVDEGVIGRALRDGALAAEQAQFSHRAEPLQTLAIPLRAHGRTLGAIYLVRQSSEPSSASSRSSRP